MSFFAWYFHEFLILCDITVMAATARIAAAQVIPSYVSDLASVHPRLSKGTEQTDRQTDGPRHCLMPSMGGA